MPLRLMPSSAPPATQAGYTSPFPPPNDLRRRISQRTRPSCSQRRCRHPKRLQRPSVQLTNASTHIGRVKYRSGNNRICWGEHAILQGEMVFMVVHVALHRISAYFKKYRKIRCGLSVVKDGKMKLRNYGGDDNFGGKSATEVS